MPYASPICGIYKIENKTSGKCYVGQSRNVNKRLAEHKRLLRRDLHPNRHLQNAFNKHGEDAFSFSLEIVCEDAKDLDAVELMLLSQEARFDFPPDYNIAIMSTTGMTGRKHSKAAREKIGNAHKGHKPWRDEAYRSSLSFASVRKNMADEEFMAKLRLVIHVYEMTNSYNEAGRRLGLDANSVRKLYLRKETYNDGHTL